MLLPESRYRFSPQNNSRNKNRVLIISTIVIALIITIVVLLFTSGVFKKKQEIFPTISGEVETLDDIWKAKNYEHLNKRCEDILAINPLDFDALVYNGFAYFQRGVGQYTLEDRLPLIDLSIVNLRKTQILDLTPLQGQIEYILGKAYYEKGKFYSDLSLKYLEVSIVSGYIGDDTYKYLGLVYSSLGDYGKSVESYLLALDKTPSDTLYLVLAQTYYQLDDVDKAEEYLIWALNKTKDSTVEEKSRFLLGRIYLDNQDFIKSIDQFEAILDANPSSAEAHYYLGDVYELMEDVAKARYQWRKALEIDPYHYGARLKLYD